MRCFKDIEILKDLRGLNEEVIKNVSRVLESMNTLKLFILNFEINRKDTSKKSKETIGENIQFKFIKHQKAI